MLEMNQERGIIKLIFIIIVTVAIMAYFKVDLRGWLTELRDIVEY
jgi:hypothetical protein